MGESMVLVRNIQNVKDEVEGEVYCRLFHQYIKRYSWEGAGMGYIEKCAAYLNSLSDEVIDRLCEASIRYCNDFCDMVGGEPKKFENIRDVLKLIQPNGLSIPKPKDENTPVIDLELNCDWEEEHGMQGMNRSGRERPEWVKTKRGVLNESIIQCDPPIRLWESKDID